MSEAIPPSLLDRVASLTLKSVKVTPYDLIDETSITTYSHGELIEFMNYWDEMADETFGAVDNGPTKRRNLVKRWLSLVSANGTWSREWSDSQWVSFIDAELTARRKYITFNNIHVLKDIIRDVIKNNDHASKEYSTFLDTETNIDKVRAELGGLLFQCYHEEEARGKHPDPLEWKDYIGDVRQYSHDIPDL